MISTGSARHSLASYLATPFVVAATTVLLYRLQRIIPPVAGAHGPSFSRAYGIVYVLGVAVLTYFGGFVPGTAALILSALAFDFFLIPPPHNWRSRSPSGIVELCLLVLVGGMVIAAIESARRARDRADRLLSESEEARAKQLATMDSSPIGVVTCDAEGNLDYANAETERIWGRTLGRVGLEGWGEFGLRNADGTPRLPDQTGMARALLGTGEIVREEIIIERPNGTLSWVMARTSPIKDGRGRILGAVSTLNDITERKAADAELERLLERDHNIAERLQDALRPEPPDSLPGLDFALHYRASLAEASVGGDFFDIFQFDRRSVALVIADLSGKGLAAAAQVATVRNMLRFALFRATNPASALTELNMILCRHGLLHGFATLFVGILDIESGHLTYVSCGHEPALLRRASSGEIIFLAATSPILGVFEEAIFEDGEITLHSGDLLMLYTDGLSEAGRSRHDYLGAEGLAALMQQGDRMETADALKRRVVSGADRHAGDATPHDDQCLLAVIFHPSAGIQATPRGLSRPVSNENSGAVPPSSPSSLRGKAENAVSADAL